MSQHDENLPVTEQENPRTREISSLPLDEVLRLINNEDQRVPAAVREALAEVAKAVEGIVARLERGGKLFYVGTGTSGRLGVLDASECPPTFGVAPDLVQGVIAGGWDALHKAVEASEDNREAGGRDLEQRGVTGNDAVVGIAASGCTPYTIGAIEHARALGAFTVAVTCVPDSEITRVAEVPIVAVVGPEAIAGSTRLKAGTAQKLILNMLSTATMIRLGYVQGNRMTNMMPRNAKLRARALRIIETQSGLDQIGARTALEAAGGDLRTALVMIKSGCTRAAAEEALSQSRGVVEHAITKINKSTNSG